MPRILKFFQLDRCPHCNVSKPSLSLRVPFDTTDHANTIRRYWKVYTCAVCGGAVLAGSAAQDGEATESYPQGKVVSDEVPEPAHRFLKQAIETQHSPDSCILVCASAVDAMLKIKGYKEGTLNARIGKAAEDHLITSEMAEWAHQIRLDANDQRHADEAAKPPHDDDARRCIDFASALAEFLFVLPSRVTRGLNDKGSTGTPATSAQHT